MTRRKLDVTLSVPVTDEYSQARKTVPMMRFRVSPRGKGGGGSESPVNGQIEVIAQSAYRAKCAAANHFKCDPTSLDLELIT